MESLIERTRANAELLIRISKPATPTFLRDHDVERKHDGDYRLVIAAIVQVEVTRSDFLLTLETPHGVRVNMTTSIFDLATIDVPRLVVSTIHDGDPADVTPLHTHVHLIKSLRLPPGPIPSLAAAIRYQKHRRPRAVSHPRSESTDESWGSSRWVFNLPVQMVIDTYAA